MTKIDEILQSPDVPNEVKETVNSLDNMGREVLNAYCDESSDFWQNAQPEVIATKFYANPEKNINLYHYTNYDALKKIVSGQQFFLGSIHFMNDTQEMSYAFKLLRDELNKLNAPQAIFEELKTIKHIMPFDVYIWCFSENDHSQSLQNYGDIAFGFKSQTVMEKLADYYSEGAQTLDDYVPGNGFVFPLKVEYDLQRQIEHISPVARAWVSAHNNYNKEPEVMGEIISTCKRAVYFFSLCFKNPYLRQEEEIRYLVLKIKDGPGFTPEFYIGDKPFVSCELTPDMLEKVILSKKLSSKIEDTKLFLEDKGFTITNVESTKLPY